MLEDERLRTKWYLYVVPSVFADGTIADEGPLGEVGQVEVGVNQAERLASIALAVVKDYVLVGELAFIAGIVDNRVAPRTGTHERLHVGQQLACDARRGGGEPVVGERAGLARYGHVVGSTRQPQVDDGCRAVLLGLDVIVGMQELQVVELIAVVVITAGTLGFGGVGAELTDGVECRLWLDVIA